MEAKISNGPTTEGAISLAQDAFSRFGLPDGIVTDNGPAFRLENWQEYLNSLGLNQLLHPTARLKTAHVNAAFNG